MNETDIDIQSMNKKCIGIEGVLFCFIPIKYFKEIFKLKEADKKFGYSSV